MKLLPSSHFLRIGICLGQLLCRNSYFCGKGTSSEIIYVQKSYSKQVLLHSINFFRTATFWEKQILQKCNILHYLVCLESHFYRAATFSKDLTFHSCFLFQTSYFFRTYFYRRDTISQLYFFPQLHFLFIS